MGGEMADLGKDLAELGQRTVSALEELHRRVDELERRQVEQPPTSGKWYTDEEIDKIVDQIVQGRDARIRDDALEEAARVVTRAAHRAEHEEAHRKYAAEFLCDAAHAIHALKSTKQ